MHRGLDAFRAFAFLAVFLYHVRLLPFGYLGVDAFFVLSGFLITPILADMRQRLPPSLYFLHFYGRRSLRILPLYFSYLAIAAVCVYVALTQSLTTQTDVLVSFVDQLPYALTYTYDFFHASRQFVQNPLLTHFWSLAVEEQFYLLWPFAVLLVPRTKLRPFLVALVIAGPLVRLAEAWLVTSAIGGIFNERMDLTIYVLPFSHVDAFAIGGYMALNSRRPARGTIAGYAAVLVVVGLITERWNTGSNALALGYGPFMSDSWKYVWGYTSVNLLFAWLLALIRDRQLLPAVLEHPALVYLGRISYGLYVYHFAVIWLMFPPELAALESQPGVRAWRAVYAVAILGITIMISGMSYWLLEEPCLKAKNKYFPRTLGSSTVPDINAQPAAAVSTATQPQNIGV